jgi:hypothetical protein
MSSTVLATRQSAFKGAGAAVEIQETGVDWKAFCLLNVTDLKLYVKTRMDKGEACTVLQNSDLTQLSRVAEDGDGIVLDGNKVTINANVAVTDKEFIYLGFII